MLIELSDKTGRFDSVVEANNNDNIEDLMIAIMKNILAIDSIFNSAISVFERYSLQHKDLVADLAKIRDLMVEDIKENKCDCEEDGIENCNRRNVLAQVSQFIQKYDQHDEKRGETEAGGKRRNLFSDN